MSVTAVSSESGTAARQAAEATQAALAAAASSSQQAPEAAATAAQSTAPPGRTLAELNQQTPTLLARLTCTPAKAEPKAGPAKAGDPDGPPPVVTQCDMPRILKDYQVSDDPGGMVDWKPSGFTGWLARTFGGDPKPVHVTASEAKLLDSLGPGGLRDMKDVKEQAFAEADKRFPSQAPAPKRNDDHNDAFRHAFWNAQMTRHFGQDFAQDYGNAHERVPLNTPNREAMDLHNNEVGRRIARDNPYVSDAKMGDLIEQAVRDGKMVVMDSNGNLVPSNAVGPTQTGHERDNAPALPGVNPQRAES